MTDTVFTNGVTVTDSDWFNDVNRLHYTLFGDPTTATNLHDSVHAKGADVASAATTVLTTATGDYVHITGTTTITAITLSSGDMRIVVFDGALLLTHNASSLILPGGTNITTAAGDVAVFRGDGGSNVRCLLYSAAAQAPVAYRAQTLTDGATITWDTSLGSIASVTLGGNRTMAAPTNLKAGTYILHIIQDGTGSRTISSWNGVFKWQSATAPTLSTGTGKRDVFSFISDGTNLYGNAMIDVR